MTSENSSDSTRPAPVRRSRWQFNLRMILLLMAAVGVWTAHLVNSRAILPLQKRIEAMRPLARELLIKDPDKIAVVKCEELWYDDNEWELYLPEGEYRLVLATRDIDQQGLAPPPHKTAALPAGRFRLALLQEKIDGGWRAQVLKDGEPLLSVDETPEWYPAHGSSGGGQFSLAEELKPDAPVVLFRRRFMRQTSPTSSTTPAGACEGLLLWIERADAEGKQP